MRQYYLIFFCRTLGDFSSFACYQNIVEVYSHSSDILSDLNIRDIDAAASADDVNKIDI